MMLAQANAAPYFCAYVFDRTLGEEWAPKNSKIMVSADPHTVSSRDAAGVDTPANANLVNANAQLDSITLSTKTATA